MFDSLPPPHRPGPLLASALLGAALVFAPVQAGAAPGSAGAAPAFAEPSVGMPQPPVVAARAFVLLDLGTRQTLGSRNADQPVEPASLTKLMTAYLVFQAVQGGKLSLGQSLPVSERAWKAGMAGGARLGVQPGKAVPVDELLKGMTVLGANDAAVALAEGVGGSVEAFVGMMNRQAQVFGLKNTRFVNPDGMTAPGHASTARDLALVAARLIADYPQALPSYYALKEFSFGGVTQTNRNLLLFRDPTVDGLQTGYTDASGYSLLATSHRPAGAGGERRLLSVVLGAASPEARANESQKLLNWGHSSFDVIQLFAARQTIATAPVWKGESATVALGRPAPVVVVIPKGQGGNLKTTLTRNDPLLAPLAQGQTVGTLTVSLGPEVWQTLPVQTLEAVPSAGWWGRLWDAIRLGVK